MPGLSSIGGVEMVVLLVLGGLAIYLVLRTRTSLSSGPTIALALLLSPFVAAVLAALLSLAIFVFV